jgi:hypothetical protein
LVKADSARSLDRLIIDVDKWSTIERDFDRFTFDMLQLSGQNGNVDASNLPSDSLHNVI